MTIYPAKDDKEFVLMTAFWLSMLNVAPDVDEALKLVDEFKVSSGDAPVTAAMMGELPHQSELFIKRKNEPAEASA